MRETNVRVLDSVDTVLIGNVTSVVGGGLVCVIVSYVTTCKSAKKSNPDEVWEATLDIDNPLQPWAETYAR